MSYTPVHTPLKHTINIFKQEVVMFQKASWGWQSDLRFRFLVWEMRWLLYMCNHNKSNMCWAWPCVRCCAENFTPISPSTYSPAIGTATILHLQLILFQTWDCYRPPRAGVELWNPTSCVLRNLGLHFLWDFIPALLDFLARSQPAKPLMRHLTSSHYETNR